MITLVIQFNGDTVSTRAEIKPNGVTVAPVGNTGAELESLKLYADSFTPHRPDICQAITEAAAHAGLKIDDTQ